MVGIEFVDNHGRPTSDFVQGWPTVTVDVDVGFVAPVDDTTILRPNFRRVRAMIDTGANHTIVDISLTIGLVPKRTVPSNNVGRIGTTNVFDILVHVVGLPSPHLLEVACHDFSAKGLSIPMLIGRDLLSRFRMIYDTPRQIFTLE